MEVKRKPFQGVLNILSFNRHFYFFGLAALLFITVVCLISDLSFGLYLAIVSLVLYGLLMPLVISAYVYDFSDYYAFRWLEKLSLPDGISNQIISINAGFDETSFIIKDHFPKSNLEVFDFYNPLNHTEPAIKRARLVSKIYPDTRAIHTSQIPILDHSVDITFLLSAVHEIRSHGERVRFLMECHRVCKAEARVIMVEHLRDLPNFLAFTVGFFHFHSRSSWRKAFEEAGFATFHEQKFTPFMSIFSCRP